ncbi:hypothetical protein Q1695_002915 [Nippostrongylus brasiliensis]|nr:hypothetical protein Q1695_002915 [Nippostrongylus brasiliensis]
MNEFERSAGRQTVYLPKIEVHHKTSKPILERCDEARVEWKHIFHSMGSTKVRLRRTCNSRKIIPRAKKSFAFSRNFEEVSLLFTYS